MIDDLLQNRFRSLSFALPDPPPEDDPDNDPEDDPKDPGSD